MKNIFFLSLLTLSSFIDAGSQKERDHLLCRAVGRNDIKTINDLLNSGSNIHCSCQGFTPVMLAALHGHVEAYSFLFKNGASVHETGDRGDTVLHAAVMGGANDTCELEARNRQSIIQDLLDKKSPVDKKNDSKYGAGTPLHYAMYLCRFDLIKPLLQARASLLETDSAGSTPLDIARQTCNDAFFVKLQTMLNQSAK